jgi:hypothetical protein
MTKRTPKFACDVCGWTGTSNDVLSAPNPFDPQGTIYGCPECKEVEQFKRVCDFADCWDSNIAGGKPTENGYMFLCSEHYNAVPVGAK